MSVVAINQEEWEMARIRVKLTSCSRLRETEIEADNVSGILKEVWKKKLYPPGMSLSVFKNEVPLSNYAEDVDEGDEVTLIPVSSGG